MQFNVMFTTSFEERSIFKKGAATIDLIEQLLSEDKFNAIKRAIRLIGDNYGASLVNLELGIEGFLILKSQLEKMSNWDMNDWGIKQRELVSNPAELRKSQIPDVDEAIVLLQSIREKMKSLMAFSESILEDESDV